MFCFLEICFFSSGPASFWCFLGAQSWRSAEKQTDLESSKKKDKRKEIKTSGSRCCGAWRVAQPFDEQFFVRRRTAICTVHTLALHTTGRNSWPYKFVVIMADGRNSCPSNYQAAGRNGWPFTTIDLISTTTHCSSTDWSDSDWSSTDRSPPDWSSTDWSSADSSSALLVLRPLTYGSANCR